MLPIQCASRPYRYDQSPFSGPPKVRDLLIFIRNLLPLVDNRTKQARFSQKIIISGIILLSFCIDIWGRLAVLTRYRVDLKKCCNRLKS